MPYADATSTEALGINDRGTVVGTYIDSTGGHGFVDDKGHFTTIDVPGATVTDAFSINASGTVVGSYDEHGFIANPSGKSAATAPVTLSDLLASQTANISTSDLLPSVGATGGPSAQSASPGGPLDNPDVALDGGLAVAGPTDTSMVELLNEVLPKP